MALRVLLALEWYDHRLHRGVARVAAAEGWHLTCAAIHAGAQPVPAGWRGDGAITLLGDVTAQRRVRRACPHVIEVGLGAGFSGPRTVVDNHAIAALAVAHFRDRGYRCFACLTHGVVAMFRERVACFTAGLKAVDLHAEVIDAADLPGQWQQRLAALGRRLSAQPGPLAVFAAQDGLGSEAILAALEAGLRVPDDVAVLGVDDVDLVCAALAVPLASVDSDQEGLGHAAALRLAGLIAGRADPGDLRRWPPRGVVARRSAEALGTAHPGLRAAIALARRDPACGVPALARAAGLSPQGLDKACRRDLQQNPGALLRRLRLDRIRDGLLADESLAVIARTAGLASATALCGVVRRATGLSPGQWRARLRREAP